MLMLSALLVIAPASTAGAFHNPLPQRCTGTQYTAAYKTLHRFVRGDDGRDIMISGSLRQKVCSTGIVKPVYITWCYNVEGQDWPTLGREYHFNTVIQDNNEGVVPYEWVLPTVPRKNAYCEEQYVEQKWLERSQNARWDAFVTVVDTRERQRKVWRGNNLL